MQVINDLNGPGPDALPTDGGRQPPFLDVNGDGIASTIDAVLVINALNSTPAPAEGESAAAAALAQVRSPASPQPAPSIATKLPRLLSKTSAGQNVRSFDLTEAQIDAFFANELDLSSGFFTAQRRRRR